MGIKLQAGSKFSAGMKLSTSNSGPAPVMPAPAYDWTSATQPFNLSNGGGTSTGAVASNSTGFAQGHISGPSEVVIYDTSGNVVHTISGPDGASGFGGYRGLLMNETHILIASSNYATDGLNVGKVWLHDVTTGTLLHSFLPAGYAQNTGASLAFGSCIGLSEKYAAIGINAYHDQPKIHQYDVSTGLLVREITPHAPVTTSQRWGHGVAISDSYVAAGVPSGSNHGYVEIFDASNGQFLRTINNPQGSSSDYFGTTVKISGDYICIATPNEDSPTFGSDTGVVYVFNITDGSLLQTITPTIATTVFGKDISVSGKHLAISDYAHVPGRTTDYAGRAFVYDMTDGSLLYTANNPTPVDYDFMGQSVSISGGSLISVARNDGQNQAHVWTAPAAPATQLPYVAPPAPPSAPTPAFFVHSGSLGRVSVPKVYDGSGNHLFTIHEGAHSAAVSAGRIYAGDHNQNRVFVYAQDGSVDFMINTPTTFSAGPHGGHFGQAIAAGYGKVAIGAPRSSENVSQQGAVYVYDADGTNEVKIQRSNPATNDMFGQKILITDAHIFVFNDNAAIICRYDHDGTNELVLTGTITRKSYQFFDNKIVTTSNNGTHVMNPDFTGEVVVAAPSGSNGFGNWSGVDTFNNRLVIQAKNAYYVYDSSDLTSPSNTISVGFSGDLGKMAVAGDKIIGLNNIGTLVKFEIIGTDGTGSYKFNLNAGPYVNLSGGSF